LPDGRAAVVSAVDVASPDIPTVRVKADGVVEEFTIDMTTGVERVVA
jgi:hypothetical protein